MTTTTQVVPSKEYETIYILRPDVDADTADKVQSRVAEVVSRDQGKLVKVEAWGRRKLAYPVKKHKKGVYVYVKYIGKGGLVAELERNLKIQDAVLKFQTVQTKHLVALADMDAAVDPEDVKFARLELPAEADEVESRERALGLVDLGPEGPKSRRPHGDGEEEFADDLDEAEPAVEAKKEDDLA